MPVKLAEQRPLQIDDEAVEAKVSTVVPGHTIIVLKSGTVLAGQLVPAAVRRRRDVMGPDGSPVYDVDWVVTTAKVPNSGLPNFDQPPPVNKLSS